MDNRFLRAALYYHGLGWCVIPCQRKEKKPLVRWEAYQDKMSTEADIRAWWSKWPEANVAVVTGRISGILVLDYDGKDGDDTLTRIGDIQPTAFVESTHGGHYYFQYPTGTDRTFRNFARKMPGLDFRGDGGYIIVPPSIHPEGKEYRWDPPPNKQSLALPPKWLSDLVDNGLSKHVGPQDIPGQISIPQGQRDSHMTSLAGSMRRRGMGPEAILAALKVENRKCVPLLTGTELLKIANSVGRYPPSGVKPEEKPLPQPIGMDQVKRTTVKWLWEPYVPLGFLTTLEGDPGEGKSFIACAIATALSVDMRVTGCDINTSEKSLILTAEDHLGATVLQRLEDMDAFLPSIMAIDEAFPLDAQGLTHIDTLVTALRPKLLVIDPIVAYLPARMDMNQANEVRSVMARLAHIAEIHELAILIIRHLSKHGQGKAIYRGQGSIDFTAACRSVLLAGHAPDDRRIKGICHIKCNLAPLGEPQGYNVEEGIFGWVENTTLTADQILAAEGDMSAVDEAKEFLADLLSDKEDMPSITVFKEGDGAGISRSSLSRAKKAMGIGGRRVGNAWCWCRPRIST